MNMSFYLNELYLKIAVKLKKICKKCLDIEHFQIAKNDLEVEQCTDPDSMAFSRL